MDSMSRDLGVSPGVSADQSAPITPPKHPWVEDFPELPPPPSPEGELNASPSGDQIHEGFEAPQPEANDPRLHLSMQAPPLKQTQVPEPPPRPARPDSAKVKAHLSSIQSPPLAQPSAQTVLPNKPIGYRDENFDFDPGSIVLPPAIPRPQLNAGSQINAGTQISAPPPQDLENEASPPTSDPMKPTPSREEVRANFMKGLIEEGRIADPTKYAKKTDAPQVTTLPNTTQIEKQQRQVTDPLGGKLTSPPDNANKFSKLTDLAKEISTTKKESVPSKFWQNVKQTKGLRLGIMAVCTAAIIAVSVLSLGAVPALLGSVVAAIAIIKVAVYMTAGLGIGICLTQKLGTTGTKATPRHIYGEKTEGPPPTAKEMRAGMEKAKETIRGLYHAGEINTQAFKLLEYCTQQSEDNTIGGSRDANGVFIPPKNFDGEVIPVGNRKYFDPTLQLKLRTLNQQCLEVINATQMRKVLKSGNNTLPAQFDEKGNVVKKEMQKTKSITSDHTELLNSPAVKQELFEETVFYDVLTEGQRQAYNDATEEGRSQIRDRLERKDEHAILTTEQRTEMLASVGNDRSKLSPEEQAELNETDGIDYQGIAQILSRAGNDRSKLSPEDLEELVKLESAGRPDLSNWLGPQKKDGSLTEEERDLVNEWQSEREGALGRVLEKQKVKLTGLLDTAMNLEEMHLMRIKTPEERQLFNAAKKEMETQSSAAPTPTPPSTAATKSLPPTPTVSAKPTPPKPTTPLPPNPNLPPPIP